MGVFDDLLTDAGSLANDTIACLIEAAQVTVTYNVVSRTPGTVSYSNAGVATIGETQLTIDVWRGTPNETEAPQPEVSRRQYIVLADDLVGHGGTVEAGDFIQDSGRWSVQSHQRGELAGADYFLIETVYVGSS